MSDASDNGVGAGRLPVATVQRIERLVGGDAVTEGQILRFIAARYGAENLLYLPPQVAAESAEAAFGADWREQNMKACSEAARRGKRT